MKKQSSFPADFENPSFRITIPGIRKPFRILHLTDFHFCELDDRNPELDGKIPWRDENFSLKGRENAKQAAGMVRHPSVDFVALTGDLVDLPTEAGMDHLESWIRGIDRPWSWTPGNHDLWDSRLPPLDGNLWRKRFEKRFSQALSFHCVTHPGFALVFIDNSDYQIGPDALESLKKQLNQNLRHFIFIHIPLSVDRLRPETVKIWGSPILFGETDWEVKDRLRWGAGEQSLPSTLEARELLTSHPNVAAVFAGHLHFDHCSPLKNGALQFVTRGVHQGGYRIVDLVPE